MEFESALGAPGAWAPVPGVPGAEGAGGGPEGVLCAAPAPLAAGPPPPPLWCVGEGEGAGLMELEDWPSEWREPVDWYMPPERRLSAL